MVALESLYFEINGTKFKQIGLYRCDDEFSIVKIKNCTNGKTKKMNYKKLIEILAKQNEELNKQL